MDASRSIILAFCCIFIAGSTVAVSAASTTTEVGNRKLLQNIVGQIVCDALGNCDDGRGRRYYDQNRDDRRRGDRNDNNGDWRRDNGRKLQQGIVGQIICDALGNCNDGRGGRWYDEGRDDRRRGDYNRGNDWNRGNDGRDRYDGRGDGDRRDNWGK